MFSMLLITANPPEPVMLNIMLSSVLLSVVCVCVSSDGVFVFDFSLLSFQLMILSLRVCTRLTNSA